MFPDFTTSQIFTYNVIGVLLAILSGFFIGTSFIIKKKGLLNSNKELGTKAGEGHGYLKSVLWWAGMLMMAIGEFCNFVAYAFTAALIVTPLGALSVVISAVLSSLILKERLNSQGKLGCTLCILGALVIVMHAPQETPVKDINSFKFLVLQLPFIAYMVIVGLASLFLAFFMAPKYGRTHMLIYIMICSIVGSVAVVFTQGFGAAIVYSFTKANQFSQSFTYITLSVVIVTQLIELNYLNKALNIFNTARVTPVYYVTFTTFTMIASSVLSRGFPSSGVNILAVVAGFGVIVTGVALIQYSKDPNELNMLGLEGPSPKGRLDSSFNGKLMTSNEVAATKRRHSELLAYQQHPTPGIGSPRILPFQLQSPRRNTLTEMDPAHLPIARVKKAPASGKVRKWERVQVSDEQATLDLEKRDSFFHKEPQ